MRPIKFRGKDVNAGDYVYGEYITMGAPYLHYVDDNDDHFNIEVEPESVAQLIGYDADDNEVYDDDVLVDEDGVEWQINTIPQLEMLISIPPV